MHRRIRSLSFGVMLLGAMMVVTPKAIAAEPAEKMSCNETFEGDLANRRLVCADVAAFEQPIVYNRFGSFNPFGMMFALKRDLSLGDVAGDAEINANTCDADDGTKAGSDNPDALKAGNVRLKDCKRPRPMVLRAAVGDVLKVRLTNLIWEEQPGFSETFCRAKSSASGKPTDEETEFEAAEIAAAGPRAAEAEAKKKNLPKHVDREKLRDLVSEIAVKDSESKSALDAEEFACSRSSKWKSPVQANISDVKTEAGDWPLTRGISFAVQGLRAVAPKGKTVNKACLGLANIPSNESVDCYYTAEREGTYFLSSKGSPAGGEGEGGSLTHGLFAAVVVQPSKTEWYRSQVSRAAFDKVWKPQTNGEKHARSNALNYNEPGDNGVPVLNMLQKWSGSENFVELVHTDLNAIIYRKGTRKGCRLESATPDCEINFREFSVFFHDELKTYFTKQFEELQQHGQLAGVRDGFAINYGASGMGTMLLANRKGIGPAADCPECLYEEFFLSSWANGDPALLEQYSDDPSNVHHSYLNDRVVFRNFHAGPKETHVFHLHAHQWFGGNDPNRGNYLDSQTVAPEQGFSYDIYHGGLMSYAPKEGSSKGKGWWESLGSGNRNRAPGDSIFHCHLYPHFAQGMWELWRNHDVLEDGTRKLPDGQLKPGLSVNVNEQPRVSRKGMVDEHGAWKPISGQSSDADGTPIPALVPLPDQALPLLPTYAKVENGIVKQYGMPGYPFYIAGKPGHRPPQPPLDMAEDGGLPRHVITGGKRKLEVAGAEVFTGYDKITGDYNKPDEFKIEVTDQEARRRASQQYVAKVLALGNFAAKFESLNLEFPGAKGSPLERAAMGFHFDGKVYDGAGTANSDLRLLQANGKPAAFVSEEGGYATLASPTTTGSNISLPKYFTTNGAPPKPGAPFADPCAVASGLEKHGPRRHRPEEVEATTDFDLKKIVDPFYASSPDFRPDPGYTGFRRYNVSAVQLDLVTNKAGWHDPQARINVLTDQSGDYKTTRRVSANEEPFFFRAHSGECIEFRHTNELPKDLELDDFQVKTPTDTIGQHIHLVKFDVTSADGSGNGWNYEDGTFAADEVVARICAAKSGATDLKVAHDRYCECAADTCKPKKEYLTYWRKKLLKDKRKEQPFQTTIQRWYADPILSSTGDSAGKADSTGELYDRTMRTVFTHDHFGPSSIQQHGFYSALIIEPTGSTVKWHQANKLAEPAKACTASTSTETCSEDVLSYVGAKKIIEAPFDDPIQDEDFREYALAIADFATLYDPQDFTNNSELMASGPSTKGLEMLACETKHRTDIAALAKNCGVGPGKTDAKVHPKDMEWSPAWIAGGMEGEFKSHKPPQSVTPEGVPPKGLDLFTAYPASAKKSDEDALIEHLKERRSAAAGCRIPELSSDGTWDIDEHGHLKTIDICGEGENARYAKPVAPPARPESISVDHHDPYLVNYRGEPIPLRVGKNKNSTEDCLSDNVEDWVVVNPDLANGQNALRSPSSFGPCSTAVQKDSEAGDMSNVFLTKQHGEPATPILEVVDGDKTVIRMIQGAQEVQHVFNVDGYGWLRNIDQKFPAGDRQLENTLPLTAHQQCLIDARVGKPKEYRSWFEKDKASGYDEVFWSDYETRVARCDNVDGRTTAQEIGISEHMEFEGKFRFNTSFEAAIAAAELKDRSRPAQTDYLYHFGSSDDLWNGAWGLLRVHRDKNNQTCKTVDGIETCSTKLSDRLAMINNRLSVESANIPPAPVPSSHDMQCPKNSDRVKTVAVALTSQQVWNAEMSYGGSLRDPDALFLAKLDWPKLSDGSDWTENTPFPLSLAQITARVKQKYIYGPKPFVLDAKAGDCVQLAIINAMAANGEGDSLRDLLGDALMPPITKLNVDPSVNPGLKYDTLNGTRDDFNLRPSARLAMRVQLPVLNDPGSFAMPYGLNAALALKPATNQIIFADLEKRSADSNAEVVSFFAGRARLPSREGEFDNAMALVCTQLQKNNPQGFLDGQFVLPSSGCVTKNGEGMPFLSKGAEVNLLPQGDTRILHILNDEVKLDIATTTAYDSLAEIVRDEYKIALQQVLASDDVVHWVPYAFGPLPLKPVGDIIGQPTHGLFGVVNVHPSSWQPVTGNDPALAGLKDELPNAVPSKRFKDGDRNLRSFTVFLQDGLGLRDKNSALKPTDSQGKQLTESGFPIKPVPDCEVCDDSYDQGEKGVNYQSMAFNRMLRAQGVECHMDMGGHGVSQINTKPEANTNLNTCKFPANFFTAAQNQGAQVMHACVGEEIAIRVIHPGGRQRQHSFTTIGLDYDDLFPGFGFPHAALLGPGKIVTASLTRKAEKGTYAWFNGTSTLRSGGSWGLLEVKECGN